MRKKVFIVIITLVGSVLLFMFIPRKAHKLSLGNVSKVHVMVKVEEGVLEKEFDTHLDEIDKMLGKLKIKKVDMATRVGWELEIIGYNEENDEEVRIFFDGDHMSYNDEQYICEREEIKELIYYFRREL